MSKTKIVTVQPKNVIREILHCGRPKCVVPGCTQPGQHSGHRRKDGSVMYRAQCSGHHALRYGMKGGYRIYKRQECANLDGRLGFKCTTFIIDRCMLDVDHIDHNHNNNAPSNLHTLCSCCHNYKTNYYDGLSGATIKKYFNENINFFKYKIKETFSPMFYKRKKKGTSRPRTQ